MYILESFKNGAARIVNSVTGYDSTFSAESEVHALSIAVGLGQADLMVVLANYRFNFEVDGLDVGNGIKILTDEKSQSRIANAFVSLKNGLIPDTPFKAATGFTRITLAEVEVIAKATAAHTRACFSGEQAVSAAIEAATTPEQIAAVDIIGLFRATYQAAYAEVMAPEA